MTSTSLAAYLALFTLAGCVFLMANLLLGLFFRPHNATPEKGEPYECGEPTIGSSHVRFDLRFYVVALVFLVFEVEVAFFFPWAAVFGTAVQMSDPRLASAVMVVGDQTTSRPTPAVVGLHETLGAPPPQAGAGRYAAIEAESLGAGRSLARLAFFDMLAFFAVLLVGYAYCWRKGDLDWVRAQSHHKSEPKAPPAASAGPAAHAPPAQPAPVGAA